MKFSEIPVGGRFMHESFVFVKTDRHSERVTCCRHNEWNAIQETNPGRRLLVADETEMELAPDAT